MPINTKKDLTHCLAKAHFLFWPRFAAGVGAGGSMSRLPRSCISSPERGPRRNARFFAAYLWTDCEVMRRQTGSTGRALCVPEQRNWLWRGPGRPGRYRLSELLWRTSNALRLPREWFWWRPWMPPRVGELHFAQGQWDEEFVSHEVFHATVHVLRAIGPSLEHVVMQHRNPAYVYGCAEEDAAYLHGAMVRDVYRWLWEVDPSKKWLRAPGASENIQ